MPTLAVTNFNIVTATLGGFIAIFCLVSYQVKEKFYLSETLISTFAGIVFSPHATNWIRPHEYALGNQETLNVITLYFSRLVLGLQLVIAGVQLPNKYLWRERKSLAILLGPGMVAMWICTSLVVWALVPNIHFIYALAVGACVTPTDPVLANNIVKGKFADKNIPKELQNIIIAESGANDGLGYPFLFLPLYLIKYVMEGGKGSTGNAGTAISMWFYEAWCFQILLGFAYGAVVGWVAKDLLHWAEQRRYVDREGFLVFAVALALFITGTAGMFGSDDVLACFIAGNTFTWDDWFRRETEDDSLQPTIDMLLNVAFFLWIGAVCPWYQFAYNNVIPIYRLIPLGILVLLLRRPPFVLLVHKQIRQIEQFKHALFVGYFGPIGVSALFYLYVALDFLKTIQVDGHMREDAERLEETLIIVVWFLVICSVMVHGLSVPLGKLGLYLPRTLSLALSEHSEGGFVFRRSVDTLSIPTTNISADRPATTPPRKVWRLRRPVVSSTTSSLPVSKRTSRLATPRGISPSRIVHLHRTPENPESRVERGSMEIVTSSGGVPTAQVDSPKEQRAAHLHQLHPLGSRSIRFPDEEWDVSESPRELEEIVVTKGDK